MKNYLIKMIDVFFRIICPCYALFIFTEGIVNKSWPIYLQSLALLILWISFCHSFIKLIEK